MTGRGVAAAGIAAADRLQVPRGGNIVWAVGMYGSRATPRNPEGKQRTKKKKTVAKRKNTSDEKMMGRAGPRHTN